MFRLLHAVLTGLLGAALLHVIIILALPDFVHANAYARVSTLGPGGRFYRLTDTVDIAPLRGPAGERSRADAGAAPPLVSEDPYLSVAACTISMDDGPVRLFADGDVPLWTVVVFDKDSNEVFSMSDRTSVTGALDILLGTAAQLPAIRKSLPDDLVQSILVPMPDEGGYAVLRAFSPRPSFQPGANDFLGNAECGSWKASG